MFLDGQWPNPKPPALDKVNSKEDLLELPRVCSTCSHWVWLKFLTLPHLSANNLTAVTPPQNQCRFSWPSFALRLSFSKSIAGNMLGWSRISSRQVAQSSSKESKWSPPPVKKQLIDRTWQGKIGWKKPRWKSLEVQNRNLYEFVQLILCNQPCDHATLPCSLL